MGRLDRSSDVRLPSSSRARIWVQWVVFLYELNGGGIMSRKFFLTLALALLFGISACKGGASTPEEYRKEMKDFYSKLSKVQNSTKEAQGCGDPMMLGRAFEKLVPAANGLKTAIDGVKVDGASLGPVHQALVDAVTTHASTLEGLSGSITSTPLPESKGALNDSAANLAEAMDTWEEALEVL
jgi:hypothetical protein